MKKSLLSVAALGVLAVCGLAGCGNKDTYEIALITDVGNIDDHSFNQSSWEGVVEFAEEKGISYNYYRPSEDSTEARNTMIDRAVSDGAKVIVLPGYLFEASVYTKQDQYPDVKFLLLDGQPNNGETYKTADNATNILYKEQEPGYLAGYAAVMEGYTKIGFMGGMEVPAVQRYGFGFVIGANDAAKVKHEQDSTFTLSINYGYTGGFVGNETVVSNANTWYTNGTQTIFACGGKIYQSVIAALNSNPQATMIGVDTDQAFDSDKIITSAMKELHASVYETLEGLYAQVGEGQSVTDVQWQDGIGGTTRTLGAKEGMVGLATGDSWRLKNYTVEQYEQLFESLKDGEITTIPTIEQFTSYLSEDANWKPTVESYVTVDYNAYK